MALVLKAERSFNNMLDATLYAEHEARMADETRRWIYRDGLGRYTVIRRRPDCPCWLIEALPSDTNPRRLTALA